MSDKELIIAVVALLVSVVALMATFMQVLQQYYASARGYTQCNERVMELRYEVQFDAPVIFVLSPTNERGSIPDAEIFYLKGTQQSLGETGTNSEVDLRKEYAKRSLKERIHTADNERASWLVLLLAVQKMEETSREWQEKQYRDLGPPSRTAATYSLPSRPPTLEEACTFTVAVQRKRKSWDIMPATVMKPDGTTTMCHLVEMMAGLGVYWKEFD
ncbi:Modin [Metarhizium acridum CQMa 102]|uniref:Modin n=1 Tax=Metarhizium acridum (strain CQMa 102) TaxID=655827 RepID=E9EF90_METAQ|nr:Modin [Metarhizium acridum CQMa 102]EFY85406.1 Modin [Metarhizium acridum CQMa 102]